MAGDFGNKHKSSIAFVALKTSFSKVNKFGRLSASGYSRSQQFSRLLFQRVIVNLAGLAFFPILYVT
jgi:hypothetical protein